MPIQDCDDAKKKLRQLEWYMDNFWILSFAVGVTSAVAAGLLMSTIYGILFAIGLIVAAGAGMGYIYKKLSDAIRKVKDYMLQHDC